MKIDTDSNVKEFFTLDCGDCFRYGTGIFIKMDDEDKNAANLKNGALLYIGPTEEVTLLPNAKVVLE